MADKSKSLKKITTSHMETTGDPPTRVIDIEAKIYKIFHILIIVIRGLIANLQTPAATVASQILETIIPVMDYLVRPQ